MCRRLDIEKKIMNNVLEVFMGYMIDGKPSPCHIWQGPDSGTGRGGGYPRMSLDGQTVAVHIVSFTNKNGFVPGKKQIDHKCNNRMCVNDLHLQMVTHKKNQKLRIKRSRKAVDALPTQHCELRSDGTSVHDRRGVQPLQFEGVFESTEASTEGRYDGRYLPDAAYW